MTKQDTFPLYTHQKLVPDYYSNYYINTTSHLKLILQEKKQKWVNSFNKKTKKKQELKKNFNKDFCSSWKTTKWIKMKKTKTDLFEKRKWKKRNKMKKKKRFFRKK